MSKHLCAPQKTQCLTDSMAKNLRGIIALLLLMLLLLLCGCSTAFRKDYLSVKEHEDNYKPDEERFTGVLVSSYITLKDEIVNLIANARDSGVIRISASFEGDPAEAMAKVRYEVLNENPLGAFAVDDIVYSSPRLIVSYYEVDIINILYRRSQEQIAGIQELRTASAFEAELELALKSYKSYMAFMITSNTVTEDSVRSYLASAYSQNLDSIVMLPDITINIYLNKATRKIVEIYFEYEYSRDDLVEMTAGLQSQANILLAELSGYGPNGASALYLANALTNLSDFKANAGGLGNTAYGVLVNHQASGRGFALAYQLFCNALGIEAYTVSGRFDESVHGWNMIRLGDSYYHVDISHFDLYGPASRFLRKDRDMLDAGYGWDSGQYKKCTGTLTYYSFAS